MKIMALDLGGGTGIAVDGAEPWVPILIPVRLPRAHDGAYGPGGWILWQKVCALIEEHRPEMLCFEAPMKTGGKKGFSNEAAHAQQLGRAYLIETIAAKYQLPCESEAVSTIRKHFVGHGRPENAKHAVHERCRILGWRAPDYDCADAAAVWDYFKSLYSSGWGARVTPLMMSGRPR